MGFGTLDHPRCQMCFLGQHSTASSVEERPDVFCSLCMAAAHVAAQDPAGADFLSFGC